MTIGDNLMAVWFTTVYLQGKVSKSLLCEFKKIALIFRFLVQIRESESASNQLKL